MISAVKYKLDLELLNAPERTTLHYSEKFNDKVFLLVYCSLLEPDKNMMTCTIQCDLLSTRDPRVRMI